MWKVIAAIIFFLLSLLVLFKAPTNFFWRLSVGITEFPFVPILVCILLILFCFKSDKYSLTALIINCLALVIFSVPITKARTRSISLEKEFDQIFPQSEGHQSTSSFRIIKMFSGTQTNKIIPEILTYKELPEKKLNLDFYSAGKKICPCVIVIHGGSWSAGDSKQLSTLNSYLANKNYHVAAINYRLAPKYLSPSPIEDTRDAINYLIKNSQKLGIDTTNFILLGRSAGGQIALVSAYTFNDIRIKGVISLYAPADMVWGGRIKVSKLVLNTEKVFNEYLGGNIDQVPEKFIESSAYESVNKNAPPTLLIHGENDAMVAFDHSVHLNRKLDSLHIKHYLLNLSWATHGCDYNIKGPSGQLCTYAIEHFLNSVTKN